MSHNDQASGVLETVQTFTESGMEGGKRRWIQSHITWCGSFGYADMHSYGHPTNCGPPHIENLYDLYGYIKQSNPVKMDCDTFPTV